MSENTSAWVALYGALGEIEPVQTDGTNAHLRNKYATIGALLNGIRGPMERNGLRVLQPYDYADGVIEVRTIFLHESGASVDFTSHLASQKLDAQSLGGAITYARRYALTAALGLTTTDDDGESAMGRGAGRSRERSAPRVDPKPSEPAERATEATEPASEPASDAANLELWRAAALDRLKGTPGAVASAVEQWGPVSGWSKPSMRVIAAWCDRGTPHDDDGRPVLL